MKGITPIISIIILLLITIGLASVAWTYMSGYMTNLISRVLDVSTTSCINGVQATLLMRNAGTNRIGTGDIKGLNLDSGASLTLVWTDLGGLPLAGNAIEAGQSARVRITNTDATNTNCTTMGQAKSCKYEMTLTGTTWKQDLSVYCTG